MPKEQKPFLRFNGGEVGKEISTLVDLEFYDSVAEVVENWSVTEEGEMHFRAGLEWISTSPDADKAVLYPFVFNITQKNGLQFTIGNLRIQQDGDPIIRSEVSTVIQSGDFSSLIGWTSITPTSSTVTFATDSLEITSDGTQEAGAKQEITVGDIGVEHGLNVKVARGPVLVKIGSTEGGADLLSVPAGTGYHSLAFTPETATVWLEIVSTDRVKRIVTSVGIAAGGDILLETLYSTTEQIEQLAHQQDRDIVWFTHDEVRPQQLERRGVTSWSLVDYAPDDGPFDTPNLDESITLTPSVQVGNGTVTASTDMFEAGHVGTLIEITYTGQYQNKVIGAPELFTKPILIEGADGREFTYKITGTFVGTFTLQRSDNEFTGWVDVATQTTADTFTLDDEKDNERLWYRLGIKAGGYTSGYAVAELIHTGGSTVGRARITAVTSPTVAEIEVIDPFGATVGTWEWALGAWNGVDGWPNAVKEWDGRLYLGTYDLLTGSQVADFNSHDVGTGEDTDAISRRLRGGAIRWISTIARLVAATDEIEHTIHSSAFEEPLAPSNISIRKPSTVGAAPVQPIVIDSRLIYADRSQAGLHELVWDLENNQYRPNDLCRGHRKICRPGIKQIAVQRRPDTRVYILRDDGQVVVLLYEPGEKIKAWQRFVTDGAFESVMVLPGYVEDEVYFSVARTVGEGTVRFTEKLGPFEVDSALEAEYADSHVVYQGEETTSISAPHLAGREVVVWADGAYHPPVTLDGSGNGTLIRAASRVCFGLSYNAPWKSMRLGSDNGFAFTFFKRPYHAALLLRDSTPYILFGTDFTKMARISDRQQSNSYDAGPGLRDIQTDPLSLEGRAKFDPRFCLKAVAPYGPVIVQAAVVSQQNNIKA